jgi:translation initiation factor IF-3
LIEISPNSNPPIVKIMDYGKFLYEEKKKQKEAKSKAHTTETKIIQVKMNTGEHDLELKAKNISKWIKEGNRIKLDLFLKGREKYMDKAFLKERLERILRLVSEDYKVAEEPKKSPKGLSMVLEKK